MQLIFSTLRRLPSRRSAKSFRKLQENLSIHSFWSCQTLFQRVPSAIPIPFPKKLCPVLLTRVISYSLSWLVYAKSLGEPPELGPIKESFHSRIFILSQRHIEHFIINKFKVIFDVSANDLDPSTIAYVGLAVRHASCWMASATSLRLLGTRSGSTRATINVLFCIRKDSCFDSILFVIAYAFILFLLIYF